MHGLRVTGLGLLGVFGVLIIFYIVVVLLGRIKAKEENKPVSSSLQLHQPAFSILVSALPPVLMPDRGSTDHRLCHDEPVIDCLPQGHDILKIEIGHQIQVGDTHR